MSGSMPQPPAGTLPAASAASSPPGQFSPPGAPPFPIAGAPQMFGGPSGPIATTPFFPPTSVPLTPAQAAHAFAAQQAAMAVGQPVMIPVGAFNYPQSVGSQSVAGDEAATFCTPPPPAKRQVTGQGVGSTPLQSVPEMFPAQVRLHRVRLHKVRPHRVLLFKLVHMMCRP